MEPRTFAMGIPVPDRYEPTSKIAQLWTQFYYFDKIFAFNLAKLVNFFKGVIELTSFLIFG